MRLPGPPSVRPTEPAWVGEVVDRMLARADTVHESLLPRLSEISDRYTRLVSAPGFVSGSRSRLLWMHRALVTLANGGQVDTGPLAALAAERREQGISLEEVRLAHRMVTEVLWESYTEVVTDLELDLAEALGRGAEIHRSLTDETVSALTTGYLSGSAISRPGARLISALAATGGPTEDLDPLCREASLEPEGTFLAAALTGAPTRLELPEGITVVVGSVGEARVVLAQHHDRDLDGAEAELLERLRDVAPHAIIGVGLSHVGLEGAVATITEARRSRQAAERLGDVSLRYRSRWSAAMALDAEDDVRGVLAPLIELLAGDAELMETARAYLAADGSLSKAAEELYLHANTVRYRLGRIGELTGIDVRGMRGGWSLYVALTLAFGDNGDTGG